MDAQGETSRAIRVLVEKNLESVASLRVFKRFGNGDKTPQGQDEKDQQCQGNEEKNEKSSKEQEEVVAYGSGSIIHCCDGFALVLSCAHTFAAFRATARDRWVDGKDMRVMVDFFDGYISPGHLLSIDWFYDLSLLMVFMDKGRRPYRPVKFTEHSCPAMGFSVDERESRLYSICCFPAEQPRALFGTALSGKICGPTRLGREIDPAFHSELRMFQFQMDGATGCSGAPLFTPTRQVMGIWLSQVGEIKFGVLVHSITEWLQRTYKIHNTSMKVVVAKLASIYSDTLAQIDQGDI